MKFCKFIGGILLFYTATGILGMEVVKKQTTGSISSQQTSEEQKSFMWFMQTMKQLKTPIMKNLSAEDQEVYNKRVQYKDDPEAVTRSRTNFVKALLKTAQDEKLDIPYEEDVLQSAVLKSTIALHSGNIIVTDEISARKKIFWELTQGEKDTWTRDKYLASSDATATVVKKWARQVADLCAQHKFIEDTNEAKQQKQEELFKEKMATLKREYAQKP